VIHAKDFHEPSNFAIQAAIDAEVVEVIVFISSREEAAIVPCPSITWAVKPIVAELSTDHTCRHGSPIPGTAKPKRSSTSQDVQSKLFHSSGHQ
jgi:hypothetical protein